MRLLFLLCCWLLLPLPAWSASASLLVDDFEHGLAPQWQAKSFKGETDYTVIAEDGNRVLRAESRAAASGLVFQREYAVRDFPVLTWRWKVAAPVVGGDETRKSGDDYAARVYVIFPHWFFPKTRTINYIWGNRLAKGGAIDNPFTANARMIAVESGPELAGRWLTERRNIRDDYRRLFGEEPPASGVIAIMSDSDNTRTSTLAWYDDLRLEGEVR